MKVLITGGGGYIGSFMVDKLLNDGYEVVVLDSMERGHKQALDGRANFVMGNVMDWNLVESIFKKHVFDAVIHFAGYISMEESMRNPGMYFHNNLYGALDIIEHMIHYKVKSLIFSSTAGVYGNPLKVPIPEDHPVNPTNPYGESKSMVEKMLYWYHQIYGLNFAALRYFNAAGAALDGKLGENHNPETHIIPLAINSILENKEFSLYGTNYNTPDGTCIRDYIHVVDLVEAHILALNKIQKDKGGYIYNVGTGKGYSNKEVINAVEKVSGAVLKIKISQKRSGDAEQLIADPSKIQNELDFVPKYSDIDTIVKTAWDWYRKLGNKNDK